MLGFVAFRVGLVIYATFVPAFWIWYRPDLTGAVDPLSLRLGLSAAAVAVLAGTYVSRWVRRHIVGLFTGLLYLLTAWFFPLVYINRLDPNYVIGILLITVSSSFGLAVMGAWKGRVERLRWYLAFVFASAIVVSLSASNPEIARPQFVATIVVIVVMAYLNAIVSKSAEARLATSEEAARASDERFRRVFESVHDVLFEIDADGRWTLLSPAWERLTGYAVEDSLGQPFQAFVYDDDRVDAEERVRGLLRQGAEVYGEHVRYRTAAGEVRWFEVRSRPSYGPDGEVCGAAGTLADVTDSVRIQAVEEARARAEELLRLKTSFLNNMSHELRTPITGILGFAEIMEDEAEGEQAHFANLIATCAHRLLHTVNTVLDLAELEGKRYEVAPERVDVVAEVAAAAAEHRAAASDKRIALDVDAEGAVPAVVDVRALHRIASNLVGNAVKFTQRGGVTVEVRATGETVRLSVADTGAGISEDALPLIFEPFRQGSEGIAREYEGNGLGLAVTRQVVELVGGTIRVESAVGVGTRFDVTLPRWASPDDRSAGAEDLRASSAV